MNMESIYPNPIPYLDVFLGNVETRDITVLDIPLVIFFILL
jgi:hypothetical protein